MCATHPLQVLAQRDETIAHLSAEYRTALQRITQLEEQVAQLTRDKVAVIAEGRWQSNQCKDALCRLDACNDRLAETQQQL